MPKRGTSVIVRANVKGQRWLLAILWTRWLSHLI